jgi:hypothetical protein
MPKIILDQHTSELVEKISDEETCLELSESSHETKQLEDKQKKICKESIKKQWANRFHAKT